MNRHVLKISVFAGIAALGWIAIAQAQRQSEEATILPPPPSGRVVENADRQPILDSRQNPLRAGQMAVSQPSNGRAVAADPFLANSIPSSSDQRDPVPAYGTESMPPAQGEMAPIRMTAYGSEPADAAAPVLAPAQDPNVPSSGEYNVPTMSPPEPSLAGDPAEQPNLGGQGYNYAQPNEPMRAPAELNERPSEPTPAPVETFAPYEAPRAASDAYAAAPASNYPPTPNYDSQAPAMADASYGAAPAREAAEPARLAMSEGTRQPAPINNYGSAGGYEASNSNYATNESGYGSAASSNGGASSYQNDQRYASNPVRSEPARDTRDNRYPTIEPVDAFAAEPSGPTGTGRPASDQSWDGEQTPQLRVVKIAPEEIQVGKPATFRVEIENVGRVTAHGVEVRDQIPQSTQLIDTKPESVVDSHGGLVWQLGKLEPGGKASVEMKLVPTAEGDDIGSVAMVRFGTPASVRTVATRPMLEVEVVAEDHVMVESDMTLTIRISNPGSGAASGVVLEERIPQGLQHPAGAELEYEVGDLPPKASKTIQLKLAAVRPGVTKNVLIARADGLKDVVRESEIEVVAPELKVAMNGPSARYLNRKVSYEVSISNPGSAAARDVRLTATLPPGLKFVEANNNGHYDASSRTVQWALAELPVNETGTVRLTALPVEMGEHAVQIQGTADRAVAVKQEQKIEVDGIAALRFQVVDVNDPIEVGSETAYEIRVLNQGTKDASNVVVQATLPPGLELVAAEGPGSLRHSMQNDRLVFEPIRRLAPKVDTSFRIRVRGRQAGDHRLRVELNSDDLRAPVTKEESTRVFGDQ